VSKDVGLFTPRKLALDDKVTSVLAGVNVESVCGFREVRINHRCSPYAGAVLKVHIDTITDSQKDVTKLEPWNRASCRKHCLSVLEEGRVNKLTGEGSVTVGAPVGGLENLKRLRE